MGGAAITIALQQLKYVLGIVNFTRKTDIVSVMKSVWSSVHHGVLMSYLAVASQIYSFVRTLLSEFPELYNCIYNPENSIFLLINYNHDTEISYLAPNFLIVSVELFLEFVELV
jgi:hypothetical protein